MRRASTPTLPPTLGAAAARRLGTLALALACGPLPVPAAAEPPAFLAPWRRAVVEPGGEAIADLTAFPFEFEGQALDRPAFIARAVPALFPPSARRCLQRARPLPEADRRWTLGCPPYGYVFGPTGAGWRLVGFYADTP